MAKKKTVKKPVNPTKVYEAGAEEARVVCAYSGETAAGVLAALAKFVEEGDYEPSTIIAEVRYDAELYSEDIPFVGNLFLTLD